MASVAADDARAVCPEAGTETPLTLRKLLVHVTGPRQIRTVLGVGRTCLVFTPHNSASPRPRGPIFDDPCCYFNALLLNR